MSASLSEAMKAERTASSAVALRSFRPLPAGAIKSRHARQPVRIIGSR
jgi:hypothetical protein